MDCLISAHCVEAELFGGLEYSDELLNCAVQIEVEDRRGLYGFVNSDFKDRGLELSRIKSLPLIKDIQDLMDSNESGFMASHDTTIVLLLQGLGGLWDGIWPKYAETLVFEKFIGDESELIRLTRDGVVIAEFTRLPIRSEMISDTPEILIS